MGPTLSACDQVNLAQGLGNFPGESHTIFNKETIPGGKFF